MLKKRFFKTKDDCEVTFEYKNDEATAVALVCEANDWQPVEMKKAKKAGSPFKTKLRLPKEGQFQYLYLVDDQKWIIDETADAQWPNEFGATNSVVSTIPGN